MLILLLSLLFSLELESIADIKVEALNETELPEQISFSGSFYRAFQWEDGQGVNLLVLSEKRAIENSVYLYAQQFLVGQDTPQLLWDIIDYEEECPYDLTVSFLPDAVRVTDLDQNGISETTIAYQLSCRSDFTPAYMKILLHEGDQKFGLRGQRTWQSGLPANFVYNANVLDEEESATLGFRVQEGRFQDTLDFQSAPPILPQFTLCILRLIQPK